MVDTTSQTQSAISVAESWLGLVDQRQYAESWNTAAGYFKAFTTQDHWNELVSAVREPLGAVVSRELSLSEYKETLPGAPDGEYVVIQFSTTFEHKKEAIETITPMKDEDGKWRVSGYFIK